MNFSHILYNFYKMYFSKFFAKKLCKMTNYFKLNYQQFYNDVLLGV